MKHRARKAAYQKQWRTANPEIVKGHWLRKYWPNSTWEEALANFNNLIKLQNNACALCKKPEIAICGKTGLVRDLSVDHCHTTKVVRGLLCSTCNRGIGYLKDDWKLCSAAADYLMPHALPSPADRKPH
jgi:hypothetical protein